MKYFFYIIAISLITLSSCKTKNEQIKKPEYLIPKDTLAMIFVDIHKIDGIVLSNSLNMNKYSKEDLYYSVFQKYDVNEDEFNSTVRYYTLNDIRTLHEIYSESLAILNEEKAELTDKLKK